jgi:hypothetical protein
LAPQKPSELAALLRASARWKLILSGGIISPMNRKPRSDNGLDAILVAAHPSTHESPDRHGPRHLPRQLLVVWNPGLRGSRAVAVIANREDSEYCHKIIVNFALTV